MSKILMIVEGAKTDFQLMKKVLSVYGIEETHTIVAYKANLYSLYNHMFKDTDPENMDIRQVLKEHEKDPEKRKIFDENYSDILLVFDLDPQDPQYDAYKIKEMIKYFDESSDNGKLYINYPMVESFYHMKSLPDNKYIEYEASMDELKKREYKTRVHNETYKGNYSKFAVTRNDYNIVIKQNYEKAMYLINEDYEGEIKYFDKGFEVYEKQKSLIEISDKVSVLCTCIFYVIDYNPALVMQ